MNEFELIRQYFSPKSKAVLGVGDDAAIISPRHDLFISKDLLISGRHFPKNTPAQAIGHKALAVNLSDMAAMGARPRWALLGLALPEVRKPWLQEFSKGFFTLAERFGVDLIGGDTTRGELMISVTILGEADKTQALRRDAAQAGDDIWLSGEIGWAGLGLRAQFGEISLSSHDADRAIQALNYPEPQIALSQNITHIAHAAIDVSDGLLADIGHVVSASAKAQHQHLQAHLQFEAIPLPNPLQHALAIGVDAVSALSFGDDYQLCFFASPQQRNNIAAIAQTLNIRLSRIGQLREVDSAASPLLLTKNGVEISTSCFGFDHFA